MASPIAAANAYASVARLGTDPSRALTSVPGLADPKSETSFTSLLKDAIGAVQEMGQKSDTQVRTAANGNSDMVNVVTAVAETEVAIDAVVAVRDKVIAAYEEIMRMPI